MERKDLLWLMHDDDDPWRNLASMIVLRALKDYQDAVVKNDKHMMKECERFFCSEWCEMLTPVDMVQAAKMLKEKVEKEGDFQWYL